MIILGIDPGTARVGYSVMKKLDGEAELITYGCLELKNSFIKFLSSPFVKTFGSYSG